MVTAASPDRPRSRATGLTDEGQDFALDWVGRRVGVAERRLLTVLSVALCPSFSDDASDTQSALELLFGAKQLVRGVIESDGGRIVASVGSRLLAVWGYPRTHESDTRKALAVAASIRRVLPAGIGARVSLDVGLVMIEPRSGSLAADAELTGPVIDAAQLMLAQCAIGRIIVSTTVRRLVDGHAVFRLLDPDAPPVAALYELESLVPRPEVLKSGPLVGHDTARAQFSACLAGAINGLRSGGLLIEGEAGIGKTSIVNEAREVAASTSDALWIEAACQHETRSVPLAPVQRALHRALLSPSAGPNAIAGMIAVRAKLGKAGTETLTAFLSAPGSRGLPDPRHHSGAHVRPMDLVVDAVLTLASQTTVVLVFEDLQWADSATRELIERLASQLSTTRRLSLVVTSREDLSDLMRIDGGSLRRIALQRLCHEQIIEIVSARPEARTLRADARSTIARQSEGVPLYAIELVRFHAPTGGTIAPPIALDSPSNLQLVIAARLDQLGELKPLVQAAAILGRRFELASLADLVAVAPTRLGPGLASLVECGIIEKEPGAAPGAYHFSHSLLRDAAYTTIPREMRTTMHRRAAEILAHAFIPGGAIAAELIAGHCERSADYTTAFTWWRTAADAAIAISESSGAIGHLDAALAAADRADPPLPIDRRIDAMRLRALQLCVVHGNASPEGVAAYQSCLALAEPQIGTSDSVVFDVLWGLQSCHLVRGDITDALAIGERLVKRIATTTEPAHRLLATRINALTLLLAGRLGEAVSGLTEVIESYRTERDARLRFEYGSDQRALALTHRAWAFTIMGRTTEAQADRTAALRAIRLLNHPHTTAHVTCVLATVAETAGERQIAASMAASGRMVADQHRFHYWSAWADLVLGTIESYVDPEGGRAVITKAIEDYRRTGARQALPYANLLLARTLNRCGHTAAALEALSEAVDLADRGGLALYAADIRCEFAELLLATNSSDNIRRAHAELALAAELAKQQGAGLFATRIAGLLNGVSLPPVTPLDVT